MKRDVISSRKEACLSRLIRLRSKKKKNEDRIVV